MEPALDLVERLPTVALLGGAVGAAAFALLAAALLGGSTAVAILALGAFVVASAGGAAALKVHLMRLPLEVAPTAVEARLDGHRAFGFRVRLGRGRAIRRGTAEVRYHPVQGEPIELDVVLAEPEAIIGPWSVVAVDRYEQVGPAGRIELAVRVIEGERDWETTRRWPLEDVVVGRFAPPLENRRGRLSWARARWSEVTPPALTG